MEQAGTVISTSVQKTSRDSCVGATRTATVTRTTVLERSRLASGHRPGSRCQREKFTSPFAKPLNCLAGERPSFAAQASAGQVPRGFADDPVRWGRRRRRSAFQACGDEKPVTKAPKVLRATWGTKFGRPASFCRSNCWRFPLVSCALSSANTYDRDDDLKLGRRRNMYAGDADLGRR
jgi:hypothetical protein